MFIESLAKLTLIYEECREKGIVIHSQEFMDETKKVIDKEIEVLQRDANFFVSQPGPHVFGVANLHIFLFPPDLTQDGTWAMVTKEHDSEEMKEAFSFVTIAGLVEKLIHVFKSLENGSTNNEERKSDTET
jgi:hypothetical protein